MNQIIVVVSLVVGVSFAQFAAAQDEKQVVFNNGVVGVLDDIDLPARDSGILIDFKGKLGQRVKAGELLGKLDTNDLEAQQKVIEVERRLAEITAQNDINVQFAQSSSKVAQKVLDKSRQANVIYRGTVSVTEIDRLALEAERGELSIERSQLDQETAATEVELQSKRLQALDVQIANRQIVSTTNGMIVSIPISEGEWVERGQTIARIIRTDRVEIVALGSAAQVDERLNGQTVKIEIDGVELFGLVTFVHPEINPASGQVQIRAEVDNSAGQLRPGSKVKMSVELP